MKIEKPGLYPWVNRGAFRHGHDCPTTRRVSIERPRIHDCNGPGVICGAKGIGCSLAEWSRNNTCDCPGAELENVAQDDLKRIVGEAIEETLLVTEDSR